MLWYSLLLVAVWFSASISIVLHSRGQRHPFKYSGLLRKGQVSPKLQVPPHIRRPAYVDHPRNEEFPHEVGPLWCITPPRSEDIPKLRVAGRIAREVLDEAVRSVRAGMTTDDIDKVVHKATVSRDSYPSPLQYKKFPKSCCTSVNEVMCHGIPDSTELHPGDIVNIDVTIFHDGVHGDCSETVFVREDVTGLLPSPSLPRSDVLDLMKTTFDALQAAISACKPGVPYSAIGGIIEDVIGPRGYSSPIEFCGHGIGRYFHCLPNVLHCRNKLRHGVMSAGHVFTIEPIVCAAPGMHLQWPDGWTVATRDGSWAAQFEHTLLVTYRGVEVLTDKLPSSPPYVWEI